MGLIITLIVGGIIPAEDAERLKAMGVARVYTPKDYDISRIMGEVVEIVSAAASRLPPRTASGALIAK